MVFCGFGFETGLDFALLGLKQVMVFEGESQKCTNGFITTFRFFIQSPLNKDVLSALSAGSLETSTAPPFAVLVLTSI